MFAFDPLLTLWVFVFRLGIAGCLSPPCPIVGAGLTNFSKLNPSRRKSPADRRRNEVPAGLLRLRWINYVSTAQEAPALPRRLAAGRTTEETGAVKMDDETEDALFYYQRP